MLSGPLRRRLDLLIIVVEQYIYSSKHLRKELSLDELVKKLTTQWKLEKCILRCNTTYLNIVLLVYYLIILKKDELKNK